MKHLSIAAGVFLLLFAGGTRLEAQELASSFDQLAVLVKRGDKITVVDIAGREIKGRIGKLSRDALILDTAAGARHLGEADVATITQRGDDSLKNGAIIGAAGATVYVVTLLAILQGSTDGREPIIPTAVTAGVFFVGLGAAAGAGIDALISGRQVIYQKSADRRRVSISPVFGHARRGAAVTVKF